MTAYLLVCNIINIIAIRNSDIPNREMKLNEIRKVDIRPKHYPDCKLHVKGNHDFDDGGDYDKTKYSRYFIKKRLTVGPQPVVGPNSNRKKYQFIATRKPIVDESNHFRGDPNQFPSELGVIYCQDSQVYLGRQGKGDLHISGRNCGIEQYLMALCLLDGDVNYSDFELDHRAKQLNLHNVFRYE